MEKFDNLKNLIDLYFKTPNDEIKEEIDNMVKTIDKKDIVEDPSLFNQIVPSRGKADTIAGEIVRALTRILYRHYNDGDNYFEGYGLEITGSSAYYLSQITNKVIQKLILETYPQQVILGTDPETVVLNLANVVLSFLQTNPKLFYTRNTVDSTMDFKNKAEDYFKEFDVIINGYDEDMDGEYL